VEYVLEVRKDNTGLPELPSEGFRSIDELKAAARGRILPGGTDSIVTPEKYAYTKTAVRRNIFRVPVE